MSPRGEGAPGRLLLPGSERHAAAGALPVGQLSGEQTSVTVVVRRRAPLPDVPVVGGPFLTRAQLAAQAGADPADVALVGRVLAAHGVRVGSDPGDSEVDRLVRAAGPVAVLAELFGVALQRVEAPGHASGTSVTFRQRTGALSVPAELAGVVTAVLGLDDRPQALAHWRPARADAATGSVTALQLGVAYRFPAGTDGTGQTLAIIELGGGYGPGDLQGYFTGLGLAVPTVTAVSVDGANNTPGADPTGADGEVLLDIEVAGALAPGASLVVYFAPNTDAGFLDAISAAVHATPTPTAISISWGQQEDAWTAQARVAFDAVFADAAALGVTVCVAAGDDGSADRAGDGTVHVDLPAASPHVLGCGGTALRTTAAGAIAQETVWNDPGHGATGGGVSRTFALPVWQQHAGVPAAPASGGGGGGGGRGGQAGPGGRGVPDVAGDADPATGYRVLVDGVPTVIGGTSAVAPLWAALVCRLAQALGRPLGLLAPALYRSAGSGQSATGLHDITSGSNGAYTAGPGWDPCTGLGSPDGTALLEYLQGGAPTG